MFDFDITWLNLLCGFELEGVYEQEAKTIINGVEQKEKRTLHAVVLRHKYTKVTLYIAHNEVIDIEFGIYPFVETGDEE